MTPGQIETTGRPVKPWTRGLLKLLVLLCIIVLGNIATQWMVDLLDFELRVQTEPMIHRLIMVSAVAYVLLMATPFVPGVEIGMVLLFTLGPKIAPLVYGCTLAALTFSFLVGRLIPESVLIGLLGDLRLRRIHALISRIEGMPGERRLAFLLEAAPRRFVPFLLRYRYLALLLAVNLPGNILIGGGGGIALLAGLSRIFSPLGFFVTVAVAIAPVPLALMLFGPSFMVWPL